MNILINKLQMKNKRILQQAEATPATIATAKVVNTNNNDVDDDDDDCSENDTAYT